MAIITISREIASFGDEIATAVAKKMGYSFVNRKMLENDLLRFGLTEEKLKKYDERKPGFWASLARDRDEYFDYLREAFFERAKSGNCVFIGRGGFAIFKDIPSSVSVRLVGSQDVRVTRLMNEFSWPEKKAQALLQESDSNRDGFHKCFFNTDHSDPTNYHLVLNTDVFTIEQAAVVIENAVQNIVDAQSIEAGIIRIEQLLEAQKIVNHIVFDLKIPVHFLEASVSETEIHLHGVADTASVIEQVISVAQSMTKDKTVRSGISIVQDYKSYP